MISALTLLNMLIGATQKRDPSVHLSQISHGLRTQRQESYCTDSLATTTVQRTVTELWCVYFTLVGPTQVSFISKILFALLLLL